MDVLRLYDKNGNENLRLFPFGFWVSSSFNENNNLICEINSTGQWVKHNYDENNNLINIERGGKIGGKIQK